MALRRDGAVGWGGGWWVVESGRLVMCLFDRCQTGIIEREARQVRHEEWRVEVRGVRRWSQ